MAVVTAIPVQIQKVLLDRERLGPDKLAGSAVASGEN